MAHSKQARATARLVRVRRVRAATVLVAFAVVTAAGAYQLLPSSSSTAPSSNGLAPMEHRVGRGGGVPATAWPAYGQAAVQIGESRIQAGPNQHEAPIASVAKVMTAYVVLRDHPLADGDEGPTIRLTAEDVADTERRSAQRESVVPVAAGEELTERQALQALLLPSANNIAVVLARWDSGSVGRFVAHMNATARLLGMTHTRYTDPSGYDDRTVSTAADQLRVVDAAMRLPAFAKIVATSSATLPVAGTVRNTDTLLGHDGFIGVKTGSDKAAGGCFAFRAVRPVHGRRTTITGVVLGQPGYDLIGAGLAAAQSIVDTVAGNRAAPGAPQPPHAPGVLPRVRTHAATGAATNTEGGNP